MVDARVPERWLWDRRFARLDDVSYRSYFQALMWSVANRTDGVIEPDDLALIPNFAKGSVKVFVAANLWTALGNRWLITDFEATQTSRSELEVLENARARERRKKQRQRAAKAIEKAPGERDVPGDCTGGWSPGTAQARQGKARPGQANEGDQQFQQSRNGHEVNGISPADLDLCHDCRDVPPVGTAARPSDDPHRCRRCNDDRMADMLAAYEEEA